MEQTKMQIYRKYCELFKFRLNKAFLPGRNGFNPLKAGTSPPFPSLLPPTASTPTATTPTGGRTDEKSESSVPIGGFPLVPPVFPPSLNLDLNATQALLNMVRTQQQLESYLKGASKRDAGNAPLDLSVSAPPPPPKKHKKSLSESVYGPDILPLLRNSRRGASGMLTAARRQAASKAASAAAAATASAATTCSSQCVDKPCTPDSQTVNHWTVEDVAGFVTTVEMCSEYATPLKRSLLQSCVTRIAALIDLNSSSRVIFTFVARDGVHLRRTCGADVRPRTTGKENRASSNLDFRSHSGTKGTPWLTQPRKRTGISEDLDEQRGRDDAVGRGKLICDSLRGIRASRSSRSFEKLDSHISSSSGFVRSNRNELLSNHEQSNHVRRGLKVLPSFRN
ncbi:unnamed protein product [Nesidiocoris tenuis]|uniref:Uncharacterized protein n=1 Tax=Nesidiocoris tenuis TaxID=355587 RepID=A0A6H5GMF7_9HEMI|nr:unnamed protein product [Nesidiocoris tenuis]